MRILLLDFTNNFDGQQFNYRFFEILKDKYDIWTAGQENPKFKIDFSDHNVFVTAPHKLGVTKETLNPVMLHAAMKKIRAIHPDIVFFHTYGLWNLWVMLTLGRRVKYISYIHAIRAFPGSKHRTLQYLGNWATSVLSDKVVLLSQSSVEPFLRLYGIRRDKVVYSRYFKAYRPFQPMRSTGRALMFGRLNPYKGLAHLEKISALCPDIVFDVVGKMEEGMEAQIDRLRSLSNVNVVDSYVTEEEMRDFYTNAEIVVLPYTSASQSGVLWDGYAYSRPGIVFNLKPLDESMVDGQTGYLIPPGDSEAFGRRLREFMALPQTEKDRMGRAAWQFGYENFALEPNVDRFVRLLMD
jgi:glycosyltransferase involved in cell wall biosynthesis